MRLHRRQTIASAVALLVVTLAFGQAFAWGAVPDAAASTTDAAASTTDAAASTIATASPESSPAVSPDEATTLSSQSDDAETITPQAGTLDNVFLKSAGSDTGTGATPATAVKTFAQAKALLAPGGTIWVCGEVDVTGTEAWDLANLGAGGVGAGSVKRWVAGSVAGISDGTFFGRLANVSGSLTITNCDINAMGDAMESAKQSPWAGTGSSTLFLSGSTASLTLSDGAIVENGIAVQGAGIALDNGSTATVTGTAQIKNCKSTDASPIADVRGSSRLVIGGSANLTGNTGAYAPIFLRGSGNTLTIQGSPTISGNTGTVAGVVQTHGSNTVSVTGGTISGNTGANCGGFLLTTGDKLTMTGGTISGNSATSGNGGAIQLNASATATVTGGSITGNSASGSGAGIYASTTGTVDVGGSASIIGNTDADTKGNVYLPANGTINVVSALTSGASVGVYAQGTAYGAGKDFANGTSAYTVQSSDVQHFSDDKGNFGTVIDSATSHQSVAWSGSLDNVFLRSSGSDASDGSSPDTAVASFAQAKKLLKPGGTIWVCGVVNASGAETWDLANYGANSTGSGTIKRWVKGQVPGITTGTYTGNLVVANGAVNSVTMTNLTLDGQKAGAVGGSVGANGGSNLWAQNQGTITLGAGCVVENGTSYHGGGASASAGGKLVMTDDSVLKDCRAGDAGGAVDLDGASSLTMSGTSSITGCTSPFAVIFLRNGYKNTVSLSDGASITGNATTRSDQGTIDGHGNGAITVAGSASISGNTAGRGGGVNLEKNDTLTMTGGSITRNTAAVLGAGVNVNVSSAKVNLSGTASISGNVDSTAKGNVAIPSGYKVNVTGALTGGASSVGVRVTAADHKSLHEFAQGSGYTAVTSDASAFFDDYTTFLVELTPGSTVSPADGTDNTIRFAGYRVAYDTYGNVTSAEDVPSPETIATKTGLSYGSANLLPTATLTRNGYIFSGWYTTTDGSGTQVTSATKYSDIQADPATLLTTIHAHWTEKVQYSVVYDPNGGSSVAGVTNLKWTATGLIPTGDNVPTRPGYTLTGWKYDPAGANVNVTDATSYRSLAKVDTVDTITLVAQWVESPAVDIAYVSNDVTAGTVTRASESVKPVSGTAVGSTAVAKAGYTFDGWYDASGTLLSTEATYVPDRDADGIYEAATYTARFSASTDTKYEVRYYLQDATGTGYTEVTADAVEAQGTTATAPAVTQNSYTGFAYERTTYQTSSAAEGATAQTIAGDDSLVVRLYYTRDTHDVTFDVQGHGVTPTGYMAVRYGATIAKPADPSQVGYTFGGWYKDSECIKAWDFSTDTMPDENLTLYAKWTINAYTVKFATEVGGTLGGTITDQTVDYGAKASDECTQTPISTDYEFLGWSYNYTGADGQAHAGVVEDYSTVPVYGDVTFTATYAKKPYVSIVATNGLDNIVQGTTPSTSGDYAVKSTIDSSVTPLVLPTQAAMNYKPVNANFSTTPDSITVTDLAGYTAELQDGVNTFTPTGSTSAVSITVSIANKTIVVTNINDSLKFAVTFVPVSTTYKVEHFEQKTDGTYPTEATDTDTYSDVEAGTTADYTPKTYACASYDATKTTWEGTGVDASSTALAVQPDGSLVIKLYYPRSAYTVSYDANGHGIAPSPQYNVLYGSTLSEPTAPSDKGWTFGGWYTDPACTDGNEWTFGQGGSTVTGDTTLYAKWTAKTYTVTYDTQGGAAIADKTGVLWADSSLTATPTRPGYTFTGWNTRADSTGDTVDATTTYSTLAGGDDTQASETIYAQWEMRSDFTLHYDSAGGTDVSDRDGVSWGQTDLVPAAPTLTGYTLDGWYTAAGDKIDATTPFSAVDPTAASDATLTAHWSANAYSVVFDKNGADATGAMADEPMTYDATAALTANVFGRPGYDFTGWNTEADGTGTAYSDQAEVENLVSDADGRITLYAQWHAHSYAIRFDGNGSTSGSMADEPMTYGVAATLTAGAFSRDGYVFSGWNTEADGSGTSYANMASVLNLTTEDGGTVTLYAQWTKNAEPVTPVTPTAGSASGTTTTPQTGDAFAGIASALAWAVAAGTAAICVAVAMRRARARSSE